MSHGLKILSIALVGIGVGAYVFSRHFLDEDSSGAASSSAVHADADDGESPMAATEPGSSQVAVTSAPPRALPPAMPTATGQPSSPYPTEAALMAKIRELGESDPEQSIKLAREGNARYPDSPEAAERAWRVAKSLVNLRRFHEARDEAKEMVKKYRGTEWANDVTRHLLVHPLDYPSREELQRMAAEADAGHE